MGLHFYTLSFKMTTSAKFGLLLLLLQFSCGIANDRGTVNTLRRKLLANYNPNRRPVLKESTVTYLSASMTILHIEKLNEKEQTVKVHGIFSLTWFDEFLKWDSDDYNNTNTILLDSVDIWVPNLVMINTAKMSSISRWWNLPVAVSAVGYVYGSTEFALDVSCYFDFSDYPNDQQDCKMGIYVLELWPWGNLKFFTVVPPKAWLYWGSAENNKTQISKWKMANVSHEMKYWSEGQLVDKINDTTYALQVMEYKLSFQRNDVYFKWTITLPVVLTSMITLLTMFPFVEFKLAINILLMNIVLQCFYIDNLMDSIPLTVNGVPKIVVFYGFNLSYTTIAALLRIILFHFQTKRNKSKLSSDEETDQNREVLGNDENSKFKKISRLVMEIDKLMYIALFFYVFSYSVCAIVNL